MKKILIPICGLIIIFIIVIIIENKSSDNKSSDNKNAEDVYKIRTHSDIAMPESIYDASRYVAIVKIESIDGCDNYSKVHKSYVYPYTYGKMKILKVIKGDLEENSVVKYYRMGGRLPASKYYEDNNEVNHKISNPDMIIETAFENDISVENGKIYLSYFDDEIYYDGDKNSYAMYGLQYGLRELKNQSSKVNYSDIDYSDIEVLDNTIGKYEKLSDVIASRK